MIKIGLVINIGVQMIETKKTQLPISLALTVAAILRDQHGIDHWQHGFDSTFTNEELAKITELSFDDKNGGKDCCKGIELLPNLKKLSIHSNQNTAYLSPTDIISIGNADLNSIEKCKNLEFLTIENQSDCSWLDVSELTNLKNLTIAGNPNLEHLDGLSTLTKLDSLTCFGNENLFKITDLDKMIENNAALKHLSLDVLLFPSAIGYKYSGQMNNKALANIDKIAKNGGCSWLQAVVGSYKGRDPWGYNITKGVLNTCRLHNAQMIELHNAACQILEDNVPLSGDRYSVVTAAELWLAKNVIYDHQHQREKQGIGPTNGDNGAYNCLVNNCCGCEGYTRGLQYLLALRGIQSHNVHCVAGRPDDKGMANLETTLSRYTFVPPDLGHLHSILCVHDDYNTYCDPCWDAGKYHAKGDKKDTSLPFCMLTKSEISKIHTLSQQERIFDTEHTRPRDEIAAAIADNEIFVRKKTRSKEVEAQRGLLQSTVAPARGMIIMGRN